MAFPAEKPSTPPPAARLPLSPDAAYTEHPTQQMAINLPPRHPIPSLPPPPSLPSLKTHRRRRHSGVPVKARSPPLPPKQPPHPKYQHPPSPPTETSPPLVPPSAEPLPPRSRNKRAPSPPKTWRSRCVVVLSPPPTAGAPPRCEEAHRRCCRRRRRRHRRPVDRCTSPTPRIRAAVAAAAAHRVPTRLQPPRTPCLRSRRRTHRTHRMREQHLAVRPGRHALFRRRRAYQGLSSVLPSSVAAHRL